MPLTICLPLHWGLSVVHGSKETVTFPDESRKVTVVLVHRCSNSVTTPADLNTEATG